MTTANEQNVDQKDSDNQGFTAQVLTLGHEIRTIEHDLNVARQRKKWSNLSLIFGPLLAVILHALWWPKWMPKDVLYAIYYPAIPAVFLFCIAAVRLKKWPGGPRRPVKDNASEQEAEAEADTNSAAWYKFYTRFKNRTRKKRTSEGELELQLAQRRDTRKALIASKDLPYKIRQVAYKEDAHDEIGKLRKEGNKYRKTNNVLQGIVIIGSLAATGLSGITVEVNPIHLSVLGMTFAVGISSGFMGYFKYKERSFYLQQTSDAIESEWEAVEVGVGRYKEITGEDKRLEAFVAEVHRLKSEQKKRQQNLEQPPDSRSTND